MGIFSFFGKRRIKDENMYGNTSNDRQNKFVLRFKSYEDLKRFEKHIDFVTSCVIDQTECDLTDEETKVMRYVVRRIYIDCIKDFCIDVFESDICKILHNICEYANAYGPMEDDLLKYVLGLKDFLVDNPFIKKEEDEYCESGIVHNRPDLDNCRSMLCYIINSTNNLPPLDWE